MTHLESCTSWWSQVLLLQMSLCCSHVDTRHAAYPSFRALSTMGTVAFTGKVIGTSSPHSGVNSVSAGTGCSWLAACRLHKKALTF